MTEKKQIVKIQPNWHTITTYGEDIYIGDMNGTLAKVSLENGMLSSIKTGLDIPYLLPSEYRLTAIGRWDTRITQWNWAESKVESGLPLVSGRITGLAFFNGARFVAGSDKEPLENGSSSKDRVELGPGKIFQLDSNDNPQLVTVTVKGQIYKMASSNGTLAYVDSEEKNKIYIRNLESGEISELVLDNTVRCLAFTGERLIYATDGEIMEIRMGENRPIEIKMLPEGFSRVLKIVPTGNGIFLLTSEGVFESTTSERISLHSGQPSDITRFENGLLTLWQDGTIEHYVSGEVANVIQIERINSE